MGEQLIPAQWRRLDGRTLKIIAVISMFIDHMGAALFPEIIFFRILGRVAFPIYCFLLVEGACHTHNYKKYVARMAIFALISEIPFDLAFYNSVVAVGHQNVFFTLAIGLGMIWFLEHPMNNDMDIPDSIHKLLTLAVAGIAAELLQTDYGFSGIAIIFIFYILRSNFVVKSIVVAIICVSMGWVEAFAILALIPIALYNGQRGRQTKIMQYGFYAFYPVHLFLLFIIHQIVLLL